MESVGVKAVFTSIPAVTASGLAIIDYI